MSVIYAAEVNHVKTYNLLVTEPDETGDKNSFIYNAYLYVTTLILIRISKVAQFDDFHFWNQWHSILYFLINLKKESCPAI